MSLKWFDRLARTTRRVLAPSSDAQRPSQEEESAIFVPQEEERTVFVPGHLLEEGGEMEVTVVNDWTFREDGGLTNRPRRRTVRVRVRPRPEAQKPPSPEAQKPPRVRLRNVGDRALDRVLVLKTYPPEDREIWLPSRARLEDISLDVSFAARWSFGLDGYKKVAQRTTKRMKVRAGKKKLNARNLGRCNPDICFHANYWEEAQPDPRYAGEPSLNLLEAKCEVVSAALRRWHAAPNRSGRICFATLVSHFNQAPEPLEGCSRAFEDIVDYLGLGRAKARAQFRGVVGGLPMEVLGQCETTTCGSEAVGYTVRLCDSCLKQPLPVIIAALAHETCHALVSELGLSMRGVGSEGKAVLDEEQLVDAAVCVTGMTELYIHALRSSAADQLGYFRRAAFEALWLRMSSKHSGSAQ